MGIDAKHSYRFVFLKSEEWQTIRTDALVANQAKCYICNKYDVSNDAHHIRYPSRWKDTKARDLIILCRKHHELVHRIMQMYPNESPKAIAKMIKQEFKLFWGSVHKIRKHGFTLWTDSQMRNYKQLIKAASRIPLLTNSPS